ncbi:MAG: Uma2 family endonuclease [Bacteroidia bacterium]|nr:Uma2 family endonuclease [Bacteroidia bacterium]
MESTIQIDLNKIYTYADYLTWNDGKRYELYNGRVKEMTPAPASRHQSILGNIFADIKFFLRKMVVKNKCKVFVAPFDVRLPKSGDDTDDDKIYTVVQPDIVVVCDPAKIDERGCIGTPDLIVEVISPSSSKNDLDYKYRLYEKAGVPEYWIVFPNDKTLTVCLLDKKRKYGVKELYSYEDKVKVRTFKGLEIDLKDIFAE